MKTFKTNLQVSTYIFYIYLYVIFIYFFINYINRTSFLVIGRNFIFNET